jgi:hypothetical protein
MQVSKATAVRVAGDVRSAPTNDGASRPAAEARVVNAVTSQAIEGLRGELARPFEFLGRAGCPWAGGKPPKG